jgi:hypothetical protein
MLAHEKSSPQPAAEGITSCRYQTENLSPNPAGAIMVDDSRTPEEGAQTSRAVGEQDNPLHSHDSRESGSTPQAHDASNVPEDFTWPPSAEDLLLSISLEVLSPPSNVCTETRQPESESVPVQPSPPTESRTAGIERPVDLTGPVDVESATGLADSAARMARTQTLEEAEIRWELERGALEKAMEILRTDAAAQLEEARAGMQRVHAEAARAIEAARAESDRALTAQQEQLGRMRAQLAQTRPGLGWVRSVTVAVVLLAALLSVGITFRRLVGGLSVAREAAAVKAPANSAANAPPDSSQAVTGQPDREPVQQPGASLKVMSHSTRRGAPGTPRGGFVYSEMDAGVSLPVPIRQELPLWPGPDHTLQATTVINDSHLQLPSRSHGVLELLIREDGSVESATMQVPIRPSIDRRVTAAAKSWHYRPALKNGRPVEFKKSIQVLLR